MFIRIGFEITIQCAEPTPLLLALLPHSTLDRRIIVWDGIRTTPEISLEEYIDTVR